MTSSGLGSAFAGFRFPREVISVAVRWYLRYGLSYRDVEELLAERGVHVDHVTVYRWVQRFTPEFVDAARPRRHCPGDRWFVDETYVKIAGRWTYLYRAIDQYGQVVDIWLSRRRDLVAARMFFTRALAAGTVPVVVTTDRAPVYPRVLDELISTAMHSTEQYANNGGEADHGRLKARLRPMRGLKRFFTHALATGSAPIEVTTARAPAHPRVLDELVPAALHDPEQYTNSRVQADHGRLKARLRPRRSLKTFRSARVLAAGHVFVQNLRRGHYDITIDAPVNHRVRAALDELTLAI